MMTWPKPFWTLVPGCRHQELAVPSGLKWRTILKTIRTHQTTFNSILDDPRPAEFSLPAWRALLGDARNYLDELEQRDVSERMTSGHLEHMLQVLIREGQVCALAFLAEAVNCVEEDVGMAGAAVGELSDEACSGFRERIERVHHELMMFWEGKPRDNEYLTLQRRLQAALSFLNQRRTTTSLSELLHGMACSLAGEGASEASVERIAGGITLAGAGDVWLSWVERAVNKAAARDITNPNGPFMRSATLSSFGYSPSRRSTHDGAYPGGSCGASPSLLSPASSSSLKSSLASSFKGLLQRLDTF